MNQALLQQLEARLNEREQSGNMRQLFLAKSEVSVDLASNDYLGFSRLFKASGNLVHGSTGSRLLSGNSLVHQNFEDWLAQFHTAETALLFNSGYDANLGLISSLLTRHDTIIYDQFSHASIIDGARLALARSLSFKHNDLDDLRAKLKHARGQVVVLVESVYSMDGDFAPLNELCQLSQEYGFSLIVDEAHATGVFGHEGQGRVHELDLCEHVFARVHTFGKALGCHGAVVVGPSVLKRSLINFARSFIYTTALPPAAVKVAQEAYDLCKMAQQERQCLSEICKYFDQRASSLECVMTNSSSAIRGIILEDRILRNTVTKLRENGIMAYAVRAPTVPVDSQRLRVVLHAFNTTQQIDQLLNIIAECL